ncbi:MAG: hypothetical protein ACRD4Y_00015 [Candidatus Acidiferrales bacterium]
MATYRIHRLKHHLRQSFRFAPHVSGTTVVKARDYEPGISVEAATPYSAYFALRDSRTPLEVGDLLESEDGKLTIFKFVGFEEAQWPAPDPTPEPALQ